MFHPHGKLTTLPETNSQFAPENGWLEDDRLSFCDPTYFQGRLLLVSGRVTFSVDPRISRNITRRNLSASFLDQLKGEAFCASQTNPMKSGLEDGS